MKGCIKCVEIFEDERNIDSICPTCFSDNVVSFEEALELLNRVATSEHSSLLNNPFDYEYSENLDESDEYSQEDVIETFGEVMADLEQIMDEEDRKFLYCTEKDNIDDN